MFDQKDDLPDVAETRAAAAEWAKWAAFDLENFINPIMAETGLTRQEVLLYLVSERLSQLAETGVDVNIMAKIEHKGPEQEGESWKQ